MPESQVYLAKKTLTDAQIKALPTTPIPIIPAPGAGKLIWPISGRVRLNSTAGAYTVIGAPIWQLVYIALSFPIEASGFVVANPGLSVAGVTSAPIPPLSSFDAAEGYLSWGLTGDEDTRTDVPLGIADVYNGIANYTDGNAANTLETWVLYAILGV